MDQTRPSLSRRLGLQSRQSKVGKVMLASLAYLFLMTVLTTREGQRDAPLQDHRSAGLHSEEQSDASLRDELEPPEELNTALKTLDPVSLGLGVVDYEDPNESFHINSPGVLNSEEWLPEGHLVKSRSLLDTVSNSPSVGHHRKRVSRETAERDRERIEDVSAEEGPEENQEKEDVPTPSKEVTDVVPAVPRPHDQVMKNLDEMEEAVENLQEMMKNNNIPCEPSLMSKNGRVWSSSGSVEGRIVTRRQNAQSVMIWAAVTATGRSPLVFVSCGVKLNSEQYISRILESKLLPWATEHFKDSQWSFQQDSAPSHSSNVFQTWIQRNILSFINKDVWPARRSDLNPLDFSIWSILETRVLATLHSSLESLKAKLQREWQAIPQEQIQGGASQMPEFWKALATPVVVMVRCVWYRCDHQIPPFSLAAMPWSSEHGGFAVHTYL
ncbi:hypothetical protein FHG87_013296 [Trinorchestia longiramus]|nr:hypothetical protein FHG87_013296 [Trinorchestia longiramus]